VPARNPEEQDASRCRVCGREAGLTFQHPAPESVRDDDPAKLFALDGWLARGAGLPGPYTLCDECSAGAAEWYLPEYAEWCRIARDAIARGRSDFELNREADPSWTSEELWDVRPGAFLKQVVTMLLAIAPARFVREHPELGRYARDPRRTGLPGRYHFYLSLYRGPFTRLVGYSAQLNVVTNRSEELVELAYAPFSCVLSLAGPASIETTEISEFAQFPVDETCVVELDLLDGFGHTPFPADFRTLAAVERDREADRRAA